MSMPSRCNSCSSTHCCVTSQPWVPVEPPVSSHGFSMLDDPMYIHYWYQSALARARVYVRREATPNRY